MTYCLYDLLSQEIDSNDTNLMGAVHYPYSCRRQVQRSCGGPELCPSTGSTPGPRSAASAVEGGSPHVGFIFERRLSDRPGNCNVRAHRSCHPRPYAKIQSLASEIPLHLPCRHRILSVSGFRNVGEMFHRTICSSLPNETVQNPRRHVATGHFHQEGFA